MDIHGYPGQPAHRTSPVLIIVLGRVLQRIFNRLPDCHLITSVASTAGLRGVNRADASCLGPSSVARVVCFFVDVASGAAGLAAGVAELDLRPCPRLAPPRRPAPRPRARPTIAEIGRAQSASRSLSASRLSQSCKLLPFQDKMRSDHFRIRQDKTIVSLSYPFKASSSGCPEHGVCFDY
mgnify:FL=1|jgi:hypothetical protein